MHVLKDGEPYAHNVSDIISLECCGCGLIHKIDIEVLNDKQVLLTFTRTNKTEPKKEE